MKELVFIFAFAAVFAIAFCFWQKSFGKSVDRLSKALALSVLAVELFRFFYSSRINQSGVIPAGSLTFSIFSLLCAAAIAGAFNTKKSGVVARQLTVLGLASALIFVVFTEKSYLLQNDAHSINIALLALEIGLFCSLCLMFAKRGLDLDYRGLAAALVVVGGTLLLTLFINYWFSASYLFESAARSSQLIGSLFASAVFADIILLFLSLVAPVALFFILNYLSKKQGSVSSKMNSADAEITDGADISESTVNIEESKTTAGGNE